MATISVSPELRDHYAGYRRSPSDWALAGARGKAANVVALCRDVPHDSVLEIGAGEGSLLQVLAARSFSRELYALDIAPASIAALRRRDIPGLAAAEVFDGYAIPYEDGRFDLALLSHVIEHAEHPRQLLYEAARVARHVLVEVPLEDRWRLPVDFVPDPTGHINFFDRAGFRRLLQTSGLRILGERVSTPARAAYLHRYGARGALRFWVKELARRAVPRLARQIWTYHAACLCAPAERPLLPPGAGS